MEGVHKSIFKGTKDHMLHQMHMQIICNGEKNSNLAEQVIEELICYLQEWLILRFHIETKTT